MKHKTLIENTFPLPLLLRNETSKPLPIAIATLLRREGVLTFHKCRKYREIGFWKPLLVAKFAENDPQMASKACLKDGKWTPRSPAPLAITFHGVWGTLLGKPSWNEPKTLKPYKTLQSIMNANLSQHRFWHCHENGLNKTIQTIPHNLYVSFK